MQISTINAAMISEKKRNIRPAQKYPRALDLLSPVALSKRLVVFNPASQQLLQILTIARQKLNGLAEFQDILPVVSYNPDNLWAISTRKNHLFTHQYCEGFVAFLMLNEKGLADLLGDRLDASKPSLSLLSAQNEKPAAIYVWALYAPGGIAGGIPLVFEKISSPLYRDAPLYARPVTPDGRRFLETIGFRKSKYSSADNLHVFDRGEKSKTSPLYDTYAVTPDRKKVSTTVARSVEDIFRIMSIRSAVYIAEQNCPYEEEFDGNDFAATHILGYVGNEPAGSLRLRFFADFVKIERLAVRHEFRNTRLAFQLVRAGIEFGRVKGYKSFYGHAQKQLAHFWSRFGFRVPPDAATLTFSDFDYIEMILTTDRHPNAINVRTNPYVIIRPEGRWHLPSILEQSAGRAAPANPPAEAAAQTMLKSSVQKITDCPLERAS